METKQDKPQETLEEALKRVGVGKSVRLAEGTIKEEIVPALELVGVNPKSIIGITNPRYLFIKIEEGMCATTISDYSEIVYIGKYLGEDRLDYKSSIAMIKSRCQVDEYACLYGIVSVEIKGATSESLNCYFLLASGKRRQKEERTTD